jgi:hypothetical protein
MLAPERCILSMRWRRWRPSGIVHQYVDGPEFPLDPGDMTIYDRQISEIPLKGDRSRTRFSHRFRSLFGCIQIDVGNGNTHSLGRERSGDYATEATAAAEHECGLIF